MNISAFTFVHNAVEGGYPIVEAVRAVQPYVDEVVAVDIQSTDGTRDLLERLGCRVLDSEWASDDWRGDDVLVRAFNMNLDGCRGDVVIFFEADEVYEARLLSSVLSEIKRGRTELAVWRLQLEQNFQRCRWYPFPTYRIFRKGLGFYPANPVVTPDYALTLPPESGFLWDCAACFRDNWKARRRNQAELWGEPRRLRVAEHFAQPNEFQDEDAYLAEPQWTWKATPFVIPEILKSLVGVTKYEAML